MAPVAAAAIAAAAIAIPVVAVRLVGERVEALGGLAVPQSVRSYHRRRAVLWRGLIGRGKLQRRRGVARRAHAPGVPGIYCKRNFCKMAVIIRFLCFVAHCPVMRVLGSCRLSALNFELFNIPLFCHDTSSRIGYITKSIIKVDYTFPLEPIKHTPNGLGQGWLYIPWR